MPQKRKAARLYLRERPGRASVWVIKDRGREISTRCPDGDLGRAEQTLAAYTHQKYRPDTQERDPARIPIAAILKLYLDDVVPNNANQDTARSIVKTLALWWGDKTLDRVKGATCRSYVKQRMEENSSACGGSAKTKHSRSVTSSTARRELKILQAAINYWHKESPLETVPRVTLPKEGPRRERFLERNEVARLLWAARKLRLHHVARFIVIGIYTGTRHAAILGLRWERSLNGGHVDFDRGILFRRGDAEKETSKRRPPHRLGRRLFGHLSRWKQSSLTGVPHVISHNGTRITTDTLRRHWLAVVKEAGLGLGGDVTPHVLRHTCATWALWEGKTVWEVAGLIGASSAVVDQIYGHHLIEKEARRA